MLARRFTIVCLIATIFGMGLAILVAESSRPAYSLNQHGLQDCRSAGAFGCYPVRHWQERPVR